MKSDKNIMKNFKFFNQQPNQVLSDYELLVIDAPVHHSCVTVSSKVSICCTTDHHNLKVCNL